MASPEKTVISPDGTIVPFVKHAELEKIDMKHVNNINQVAGKNPLSVNLRDHPEFSGMDLYVQEVTFHEGTGDGKKTLFLVATGRICAPGGDPNKVEPVVLITGASNVFDRVAVAAAAGAFPIKGTLRKSGRAWFLD